MLLSNAAGEILLEQRPPAGIWGGLWSLPEVAPGLSLDAWCREHMGLGVSVIEEWPCVQHTFSHFHLEITPVLARAEFPADGVREQRKRIWCKPEGRSDWGLAAPVERLLQRYSEQRPKE